jgi:hypothetical protein
MLEYIEKEGQSWPKRVLELLTTKDVKNFNIVYYRNKGKDFLLVENDTYFLESYALRPVLTYDVFVS